MNQGRIWCVVSPTVGLPLFIGGVAVTSLVVHASVMTHVSWMGDYWQGAAAKTAMVEPGVSPLASNVSKTEDGYVITVTVAPDAAAKLSALDAAKAPDAVKVASQ